MLELQTEESIFNLPQTFRLERLCFKGELHPKSKFPCFRHYFKIFSTFLKNNISILKQNDILHVWINYSRSAEVLRFKSHVLSFSESLPGKSVFFKVMIILRYRTKYTQFRFWVAYFLKGMENLFCCFSSKAIPRPWKVYLSISSEV